jgi:hypothetical protein
MTSPADRPQPLRLVARGNLIAGATLVLLAIVLFVMAAVVDYAPVARTLVVLGGLLAIGLALRCRQPSVEVGATKLIVRSWMHTNRLELDEVAEAAVLETWDGGVWVRKLAIVTADGTKIKSNFQSRPHRGQPDQTATDAAALAMGQRLGSAPQAA